ncbi:hypothetical protein PAHAL_9G222200 [Panicum hallii]|uniref:GRF-type domain-containing protein n=1 Tax=Panicum hallii TaxID=206008 RepID=A0A2T8I256_9POAL|nr:hypothetical protein PAHAL_9G222200 [Panicum hallii]
MPSSSSSSLLSSSNTASAELPLIPCKLCNGVVIERVSKQPETTSRKFYRCRAKKTDGSQCDFFHWQASYAVLLIKDGEMKKKLSNLELVMEELDNVKKSMKATMVEIEENKKSTAAALKLFHIIQLFHH